MARKNADTKNAPAGDEPGAGAVVHADAGHAEAVAKGEKLSDKAYLRELRSSMSNS